MTGTVVGTPYTPELDTKTTLRTPSARAAARTFAVPATFMAWISTSLTAANCGFMRWPAARW